MLLKKKNDIHCHHHSPGPPQTSPPPPTTLFPQQHLERLTLENPSVDATGGDKTELVTPGRKAFGEPGRP